MPTTPQESADGGPRVSVDEAGLQRELRLAAYLSSNSLLVQHGLLSGLGMSPAKLLVYLTISTSTIQRFMRQGDIAPDLRGSAPLDDTMVGHISRRAVAAATGIPRENVRRIIVELIAEGRVIDWPGQGLTASRALLSQAFAQDATRAIVGELARLCDSLLRAGVLTIETAKPSESRRPEEVQP